MKPAMAAAGFSAILAALVCGAGGCAAVGVAAYVMGPPAVEAKYVPAKTPMLVLAESYGSPGASTLAAEQLERMVIEQLKYRDIVPVAPDSEKVYELRLAEPQSFREMSIAALGREAGALQVLYINMSVESGDIAPGAEMIRGQAAAAIRVVDVASAATLWPQDIDGGYPVRYQSKFSRAAPGINATTVRRDVLEGLADRIVKSFYKYKPEEEELAND